MPKTARSVKYRLDRTPDL